MHTYTYLYAHKRLSPISSRLEIGDKGSKGANDYLYSQWVASAFFALKTSFDECLCVFMLKMAVLKKHLSLLQEELSEKAVVKLPIML